MSEFSELPEEPQVGGEDTSESVTTEKLFVDSNNVPYKFFISHDEPDLTRLTKLIDDNGGEVYNEISADDRDNLNSIIVIASSLDLVKHLDDSITRFYTPDFIYKSVELNATQRLEEYQFGKELVELVEYNHQVPEGAKKMLRYGFTAEEDSMIINEARKNPRMVDSKYFLQQLHKKMPDHPISSIRSRFRNRLRDQIKFFYKVKKNGELMKDDNGNYIIDTSTTHRGIKSAYTLKEDYVLCKMLSMQTLGPNKNNANEIVVTSYNITNFFVDLSRKYSTHTSSSWRDRYRKFAVPRGILKYKDYYELCKLMSDEPVTLTYFNDQVMNATKRKFELFKQEKKNANEEIPTFVLSEDERDELDLDDDDDEEDIFVSPPQSPSQSDQVNLYENLTPRKKGLPSRKMVLNISPVTSPRLEPVVEKKRPTESEPSTPQKKQKSNEIKEEQIDSELLESTQLETPQLETPPSSDPLIDDEILSSMKISEFLNKISTISRQCADAEDLINTLEDSLGISKKLTEIALVAVSGDVLKFTEYFQHYLETGEISPVGVPGIFTPEYDEIILDFGETRKEEFDQMVKLHNMRRCKHRRQFLKSLDL